MPPILDWLFQAGASLAHAVTFVRAMAVTFAVAGIVSFLAVTVRRQQPFSVRGFLNHCLPWAHWKSVSTRVDVLIYLISKFTQKWIVLAMGAVVLYLATSAAQTVGAWMQLGQPLPAGPVTVVAIAVVLFAFADLGEYLSHAVQHKVPFLWEFHKIHHSALFLTPFTTYRFHPVGNLLDGVFMGAALAIPVAAAQLLFGFSFLQLMALSGTADFLGTILLLTTLQHTHFQVSFGVLDRVFISPVMHQVHHSRKPEHWGKNLGSKLSVWDWCFGSGLKLPKGEVIQHGLGTAEDARGDYGSIWWCYVGPVVECWRLAKQAIAGRPRAHTQDGVAAHPASQIAGE